MVVCAMKNVTFLLEITSVSAQQLSEGRTAQRYDIASSQCPELPYK